MSDDFDPYRKWLGIPLHERPPDHYRLLGIPSFEDDPDVIENAADRQMAHVRRFQMGKQSILSQRILNELSAARVCLLNTAKKTAYDQQLHSVVDQSGANTDSDPSIMVKEMAEWAKSEPLHHRVLPQKRRRLPRLVVVLGAACAVLLLLLLAGYVANWGREDSRSEPPPVKRPHLVLPPLPKPGDPLSPISAPEDGVESDDAQQESASEEP